MKVSFVVPVFNVEKYIGECIESILNQTNRDWELILINDGSKDDSGKICDYYSRQSDRIRVIHQVNQGVSVARNQGIKAARGEWIFFIDGDDAIQLSMLESVYSQLNDNNDICFYEHEEIEDSKFENEKREFEVSKQYFELNDKDFKDLQFAIFNRDRQGKYDYYKLKPATPCKGYRKEVIWNNGLEFPVGVITGEDAIFNFQFYRFAERGVYFPKQFYMHRIWGDSISQRYNPSVEEHFKILHEQFIQYMKKENIYECFKNNFYERILWSIGFCCILNFCHKKNPYSYKKRKKQFMQCIYNYGGIKSIQGSLKEFRLKKKVMFFCIQHQLFFLINMLCKLSGGK